MTDTPQKTTPGRRRWLVLTVLFPVLAYAAGDHGPGMPGHDQPADSAEIHGQDEAPHMEEMHGEAHAHATWVSPPEPFSGMSSAIWGDERAIERGRPLFEQNCTVCHGIDGKGTGIAATSLEHAPADLTQNLHSSLANNDGYLFWRVTKGGSVEPFRSQNSAMPAFEQVLSEDQRWDVLAYVHTVFHRGFIEDKPAEATEAEGPHNDEQDPGHDSPGKSANHWHG